MYTFLEQCAFFRSCPLFLCLSALFSGHVHVFFLGGGGTYTLCHVCTIRFLGHWPFFSRPICIFFLGTFVFFSHSICSFLSPFGLFIALFWIWVTLKRRPDPELFPKRRLFLTFLSQLSAIWQACWKIKHFLTTLYCNT
jgi:hypothetical protein